MSGGTFSVSRKIWEHEVFIPSPFSEREAFLWLVSEASWKPRTKRVGSVIVALDRGQLSHSTRFLSDAWQWSHSKVRRFLDRLEKYDMICRQADTGVSVISLINYDAYQMGGQSNGTAAAQQRHSSGTNYKKGEIKGRKESASDALRFQEFWDAYPHRNGKKDKRAKCVEKYTSAVNGGATEAEIIKAAIDYQNDPDVKRGFGRAAETWLNQKGWQDETTPDTRSWRDKSEIEWTKADRDAERMRWL